MTCAARDSLGWRGVHEHQLRPGLACLGWRDRFTSVGGIEQTRRAPVAEGSSCGWQESSMEINHQRFKMGEG
jgi:hypothetical protein